ncbi:unnamed protein product [Ambrosiozyma monospora]|uniref:Unnamed protein product n=1 Tax=Ambrosiozyma monospora TaxID=43982 RepID=A0A9W7DH22_AMBMO|nr:unnamed protein product [Ambrosiozyma monospora]
MEENVSKLMELGISAEDARDALKRFNNNIEQAVNHALDPSPELPQYTAEEERNMQLVPLGTDPTANGTSYAYGPNVEQHTNQLHQPLKTASVQIDEDVKSRIAQFGYGTETVPVTEDESISVKESYDVYEDPTRFHRKQGEPGVLLPLESRMLESVFAPLLMIFSNVTKFRNTVLTPQYDDYGYAPHWWKKEKCVQNPKVTLEIQRYLAFLTGDSDRAFASIRNLTIATQKLIKDEYDAVSEFITFILDSLVTLFGTSELETPMNELFVSNITSTSYGHESFQSYKLFPVEPSSLDTDIYKIMHKTLWGHDFESLGSSHFVNISDIVTVSLDSDGDPITGGFELDEKVFFQIYTKDYEHLVSDKRKELKSIGEQISKLNAQSMRLRSFKGKNIASLLSGTAEYLAQDNDNSEETKRAYEEILSIETHLQEYKQSRTRKFLELNQKKNKIDLYDIDSILGDLKEQLEPMILVGVILTESEFYYLDKTTKKWVYMRYLLDDEKNFDFYEIDFADVQDKIKAYSMEEFERGMTLIYVRESVFGNTTMLPLNDSLQDFIEKDNKQLKHELDCYYAKYNENETARATVTDDEDAPPGELWLDASDEDASIEDEGETDDTDAVGFDKLNGIHLDEKDSKPSNGEQ